MSRIHYSKQVWTDGETPINSERMTHIEEGISTATRFADHATPVVVEKIFNNGIRNFVLDATFDDIDDAISYGTPVIVIFKNEQEFISSYNADGSVVGYVSFVGTISDDQLGGDAVVVDFPAKKFNEIYMENDGGELELIARYQ